MSDLERRIEAWRVELTQSQAVAASDVSELESHLREEIAHLQEAGLAEVEAFLVACHRLGDAAGLAREFRKVTGDWRLWQRLSWMALGTLVYVLGGYVVAGVSHSSALVASLLGFRGYGLGLIALNAQVAAIAGMLALAWVIVLKWSQGEPKTRSTIFSERRPLSLLAIVTGINGALIVGHLLSRIVLARLLGVVELGRIAYLSSFASVAWWFLGPVLLAAATIALRAHALRSRRACAGGPSE